MSTFSSSRVDMMEAAFTSNRDATLFLQLADAYRESGDHDRALRILRRGMENHPSNTAAFALLARILVETNRPNEAIVTLERLLELDPVNTEALGMLARLRAQREGQQARPQPPADAAPTVPTPLPTPPAPGHPHYRPPAARGTEPNPAFPSPPQPRLQPPPAEPEPPRVREPEPRAFAPVEPTPRPPEPRAYAPVDPAPHPAVPMPSWIPAAEPEQQVPPPPPPPAAHPDARALAASLEATHGRVAEEPLAAVGHVDSTAVALSDLLVGLLEYRDPFFRGGTSLTRLLTTAIAREMGVEDEVVKAIALGAVLRDVGQLPLKNMLNRPGVELGEEHRRKMERHVETALDMLAGVSLPAVTRDTIRHHHERWDGVGYPGRLTGEAIPLGARIVAVADSFTAMIAARPYRLPRRVHAALEDIKAASGSQYDPAVVMALVNVINSTNWKGPGFALRHHVLIVDPDETRAMVIATKLCSNGYLAEAAFNVTAANERLEKTRLAALIVSSDMAPQDEMTLLRLVRENARLGMIPVIITDTGVSERVALLEGGADVCLNRGASFEELEATLKAFLRRESKATPGTSLPAGKAGAETPWSGLQGDIQDFPLAWLLQVLNYDSRTAAVFLSGAGDEGVIFLDKGNPRHAQTKVLSGEDAFRAMLKWRHGSFSVDPEVHSDHVSIRSSLMNLLLDQALEDDHAAFFGQVQT